MPIDFRMQDPGILTITYRGEFSDAEYEQALDRMASELEQAKASRRRIAFVSIGAADSSMSPKQRRRSSEWLEQNAALLRAACVGQAVVVPGTMQRGVLTAILWMGEYPVPMRACASEAEADTFVRSMLRG